MANFSTSKTGLESPTPFKTPQEAPLPSALNSPALQGTFQAVGLSVSIMGPVFGILANTEPVNTAAYALQQYRRFRTSHREHLFNGDPEIAVYVNYKVTYSQHPTTYYPSIVAEASPEYLAFNPDLATYFNHSSGHLTPGIGPDDPRWNTRGPTSISYTLENGLYELESRADEFTAADVSSKILASLALLNSQDMPAVWAGTDTYPYSGYWYCYPAGHIAEQSPEQSMPAYGTAGTIAALEAYLASYNSPPYDGALKPQLNGYNGSGGVNVTSHGFRSAPPFNGTRHGYYPGVGLVTDRKQIKGVVPTRYTIVEWVTGQAAGTVRGACRVVSKGILMPGQIVELPMPSRTDFPFISAQGICVGWMLVLFIPELDPLDFLGAATYGEYVAAF